MTPSARISAAIEVLADIEANRRPAVDTLKAWGLAHRFAGSGDRAAIAGLVYDTLRRKASAAYLMGSETPRAAVLGMLSLERGLNLDALRALFSGERFASAPLDPAEEAMLTSAKLEDAPPHVTGDFPEWLDPFLARTFGDERAQEAAALARRAPLDLRVNTLKGRPADALAALAHLGARPCRFSPIGLRIDLGADAKSPAIQAEPAHLTGLIEVQDEGSQLVAQLAGAAAGEQVIDLCAGAGGKTLALAATMENRGRIFATDRDKRRLAPIHDRLKRAGVKIVDVRTPAGAADPVGDLARAADLVLIDAPCTGTGTWRRNPDAKWRTRPGALEQRRKEQAEVLDRAAALVKPGGRIAYVTCSVLMEENDDQVQGFTRGHPQFRIVSPREFTGLPRAAADELFQAARVTEAGLLMTPRRTGTDGFFLSILRHTGSG
jgi:16S rRNA (cytosine967-C5)-methyltransferase